MKISVAYPPLSSEKGTPLLTQNRQFQWFTNPTYIYPMVPAYAASLLAARGHDVSFDDGIADEKRYDAFMRELFAKAPDL